MPHPHKPLQHYIDSLPADLTVCTLIPHDTMKRYKAAIA